MGRNASELTGGDPVDGVVFCYESADFVKVVRHVSLEAAVPGRAQHLCRDLVFWYNFDVARRTEMPTLMKQIDQLSASEKMRLMEYLLKSISAIVDGQSEGKNDPREEHFGCPRPDYSKLVGYGAKFHAPRPTSEWMKELREGEKE